MTLNDLLLKHDISPNQVVVMRHRPREAELRKIFPWLAAEKPALFNAYQQSHGGKVQTAMEKMCGKGYLASFVGLSAGEAVFSGLYRIAGAEEVSFSQFWKIPENIALGELGMIGWRKEDAHLRTLWFDLLLTPFYQGWCGKLTVSWPPPERAWFRRAERNEMKILSIPEESLFTESMPGWEKINLTWAQLQTMPTTWRSALSHWRGIYHIHDESDGGGYVGSAYGNENILGRWLDYSKTGHGGNKLLRLRKKENLHFSILQRVSPDMPPEEIIRLETSWKDRLHTCGPFGLNEN